MLQRTVQFSSSVYNVVLIVQVLDALHVESLALSDVHRRAALPHTSFIDGVWWLVARLLEGSARESQTSYLHVVAVEKCSLYASDRRLRELR